MCFERRFAPCVSFAIVAFCLQTVHLILQTCVSFTIVASRFTNATFRFTIKPLLSPLNCKVKRTGSRGADVPITLKQPSKATIAIHFTRDFKINLSFGEKVNLAFSPY